MKKLALFVVIIACVVALTACAAQDGQTSYITIVFDTGTGVQFSVKTNGNQVIRMPDTPQREGYTFNGWYYDLDGVYTEFKNDTLTYYPITEDITVSAKWTAEPPRQDGNYFGAAADAKISSIIDNLIDFDNCQIQIQKHDTVSAEAYTVKYDKKGDEFALAFIYADRTEYYGPSDTEGVYYHIITSSHGGFYKKVYRQSCVLLLQELLPSAYLEGKNELFTHNTDLNTAAVEAYYGGNFAAVYKNTLTIKAGRADFRLAYPYLDADKRLVYRELVADAQNGLVGEIRLSSGLDNRFGAPTSPFGDSETRLYTYGETSVDLPSLQTMTYMGEPSREYLLVGFFAGYGTLEVEPYIVVSANTTITLPAATLQGREFLGWYDQDGLYRFGGEGDQLTLTDYDLKLYARWQEVLPIFELDGGYFDQPLSDCVYFELANDWHYPLKTGYAFGGWYLDEALTQPVSDSEDIYTRQDVVYASWIQQLKLDIVANNGKFLPSLYGEEGQNFADDLPQPSDGDMVFEGWYTDAELSMPLQDAVFAPDLTTIFAAYTDSFIVTYELFGASYRNSFALGCANEHVLSTLAAQIQAVILAQDPTCELRGIFTDEEYSELILDTHTYEETTVYPQVAPKAYISVVKGQGKIKPEYLYDMLAQERISLYSQLYDITNVSEYLTSVFGGYIKAPFGYQIASWYLDADYAVEVSELDNYDENISLYPKYELTEEKYVSFDLDVGRVAFSDIEDIFTTVPLSDFEPSAMLQGYADSLGQMALPQGMGFEGWYADAACTQLYDFDQPLPQTSFTIYAKIVQI